ncbi:antiterminator Q family protein [Escherichia coli]
MRDMYEVLDRWGAWAAADNSGVDWQPIAAGFKGLLPHGKKIRLQCDDDEGIMIDGCVARLYKYKPDEYELIIAHFVIGNDGLEGVSYIPYKDTGADGTPGIIHSRRIC